jgi:hypothetical protein
MREALGDQNKTYPSLQKQTILFSKLKTHQQKPLQTIVRALTDDPLQYFFH